ncbi:MAG: TonB-dependent receptor plug domain-containing protein [Flavobacteriales bacterium]|nr:TonB-dependent receptor plug domain-containing protein [Flavobacteriales bacterium]
MSFPRTAIFWLFLLFCIPSAFAQITIKGVVRDEAEEPLFGVVVHVEGVPDNFSTDEKGRYRLDGLTPGLKKITYFQQGYKKEERTIDPKNGTHILDVILKPLSKDLNTVTVTDKREDNGVMTTLRAVDGMAIYAGRKTEVIQLDKVTANLASNRARQVFSQVTGLNIWESDCGGIQIGVGGRGLSPSRTENFNTRQNGYDIAADALGYPESYYSPPMLAVKKIEVVRGAASLQYGPQFGGMLNFVMKEGPDSAKIQAEAVQSVGSYGFYNTYTSLGGTIGRFNYYTSFQYRLGKCWRCNSEFDSYNAYAALKYTSKKGTTIKAEYTRMWYLARQAGGLTDAQFAQDPRASYRDRNWFRVKWNVMALSIRHEFSSATKVDVRLFGLMAIREALGFLSPPNVSDPINNPGVSDIDKYRNLIHGDFNNVGGEFRFLQRYHIKNQPQTFLTGVRVYKGFTKSRQGAADSTYGPVFEYVDVVANQSASSHPSGNVAWFAENVFNLRKNLSITPGVRIEYIDTKTVGSSHTVYRDQADNVILDSLKTGESRRKRWFPLFGIGVSYKPLKGIELYANFSQNYKSINFNDLWVANPSYKTDPNMKDETGYNADLGIRGRIRNAFQYEVTGFMMMYNDRIGYVQQVDPLLYSVYRLRTNVANARSVGVESYLRWSTIQTFRPNSDWKLDVFSNITWLSAKYIASEESAFRNKRVELTPALLIRTGLDFGYKDFRMSYLFSYTDKQFTDATNSISTGNSVNGLVPSYYVMDLNFAYKYWKLTFNAGIENLTNNWYFTRRAVGYPGPGIIPSSGRTFYITIAIKV